MTGEDVVARAQSDNSQEGEISKTASRRTAYARRTAMISEMEIEKLNETMGTVFLDPDQKSQHAQDFE